MKLQELTLSAPTGILGSGGIIIYGTILLLVFIVQSRWSYEEEQHQIYHT